MPSLKLSMCNGKQNWDLSAFISRWLAKFGERPRIHTWAGFSASFLWYLFVFLLLHSSLFLTFLYCLFHSPQLLPPSPFPASIDTNPIHRDTEAKANSAFQFLLKAESHSQMPKRLQKNANRGKGSSKMQPFAAGLVFKMYWYNYFISPLPPLKNKHKNEDFGRRSLLPCLHSIRHLIIKNNCRCVLWHMFSSSGLISLGKRTQVIWKKEKKRGSFVLLIQYSLKCISLCVLLRPNN